MDVLIPRISLISLSVDVCLFSVFVSLFVWDETFIYSKWIHKRNWGILNFKLLWDKLMERIFFVVAMNIWKVVQCCHTLVVNYISKVFQNPGIKILLSRNFMFLCNIINERILTLLKGYKEYKEEYSIQTIQST